MADAFAPISFGKYVLLERIATGGMAEIYKARYAPDGAFQKIVVLKRILPVLASDPEFVEMFREEAALTVQLSHANIVHVFDFGKNGADWFLAMEFVRGPTLRDVMLRARALKESIPIPFALYIGAEVAKGLQHAHSRKDDIGVPLNIVHRDVSPSNVLLSYEGEVKITDFGIARMASRVSRTAEGMVRGKASYLSPEQAAGDPSDARSDLFSLGTVMWEVMTGARLFQGDSPSETMSRVMAADVPRLTTLVPGAPPEVEAFLSRVLAREPGDRPADALALSREISALCGRIGADWTQADAAEYLAPRFANEIASDELRRMRESSATVAAETPSVTQAPAVVTRAPRATALPPPSPLLEDEVPQVERLDHEERKKLFDLPSPADAPRPRSSAPRADAPKFVPLSDAPPLDVGPLAAAVPAPAPKPGSVATSSDHFLDLDTSQIAGPVDGGEARVVKRIRVGRPIAPLVRASLAGATALVTLLWGLKFVYRY